MKIALVSYLNTEPFLYGLKHKGTEFKLFRAIPSICRTMFKSGEVDIALVPVVTYFEEKQSIIITDYAIGCNDNVRTVVLFSNQSKEQITKIYLDNHSRTSVQLLKVIVRNYWNLNVVFETANVADIELTEGEGVLMIGDKVFSNEERFKYVYDLGREWNEYTGLPFVFAVWLSNQNLSIDIVNRLNEVLKYGIQNITKIIESYIGRSEIDLASYFNDNISYTLGNQGKEAIELFRKEIIKAERSDLK